MNYALWRMRWINHHRIFGWLVGDQIGIIIARPRPFKVVSPGNLHPSSVLEPEQTAATHTSESIQYASSF